MGTTISGALEAEVNIPGGDLVQYASALGCAILARKRLEKLDAGDGVAAVAGAPA
jgi:hypothetical protein